MVGKTRPHPNEFARTHRYTITSIILYAQKGQITHEKPSTAIVSVRDDPEFDELTERFPNGLKELLAEKNNIFGTPEHTPTSENRGALASRRVSAPNKMEHIHKKNMATLRAALRTK